MKFCKCLIAPGKVIEVDDPVFPVHPECGGLLWSASDKDARIAELGRVLEELLESLGAIVSWSSDCYCMNEEEAQKVGGKECPTCAGKEAIAEIKTVKGEE